MKVKYNRVSTLQQTGLRFTEDKEDYDLVFLDKISGSISFKERPQAKKLIKIIEEGKLKDLIVEEFSRLGRNTGDVINTLDWLETYNVNVIVRNLGLQSRPNGIKNPIWKMISSIMSSLYEMELQNIKERTSIGRLVFVQNGGTLGRPLGTNETELSFLAKESTKNVGNALNKGLTIREASKVAEVSTRTVMKVKRILEKRKIKS